MRQLNEEGGGGRGGVILVEMCDRMREGLNEVEGRGGNEGR